MIETAATNQTHIGTALLPGMPTRKPLPNDIKVLHRVPKPEINYGLMVSGATVFTIIDLETTGLDSRNNEIIEFGSLSFVLNDGKPYIVDTCNELQQPKKPLPTHITQVTGLTDSDLKGHSINWHKVEDVLKKSDYVFCHNAGFDRKFLESQTPSNISMLVQTKNFGCTQQDIDWLSRGFIKPALENINFTAGWFYDAHRALDDCYATYNILVQKEFQDSLAELIKATNQARYIIEATNAPFPLKDVLRGNGYKWNAFKKVWFKNTIDVEQEQEWLENELKVRPTVRTIESIDKYSTRG